MWFGLNAPAGTPAAVIARLNAEFQRALALPELREQLARQSIEPIGGTPDAFAAFVRRETDKWGRIVKEAGIKME